MNSLLFLGRWSYLLTERVIAGGTVSFRKKVTRAVKPQPLQGCF